MCTSGSAKARAPANVPVASFSERDGGCLYLISTGQSAQPSYFGDASADGTNVFFFTRQSLVGQDQDENYDVYDARVNGGIAAQNPPPWAQCTGETCRTAPEAPPVFGVPSSTTITDGGNLPQVEPKPVQKPKVKKRKKRKKHSNKTRKKARAKTKKRKSVRKRRS